MLFISAFMVIWRLNGPIFNFNFLNIKTVPQTPKNLTLGVLKGFIVVFKRYPVAVFKKAFRRFRRLMI